MVPPKPRLVAGAADGSRAALLRHEKASFLTPVPHRGVSVRFPILFMSLLTTAGERISAAEKQQSPVANLSHRGLGNCRACRRPQSAPPRHSTARLERRSTDQKPRSRNSRTLPVRSGADSMAADALPGSYGSPGIADEICFAISLARPPTSSSKRTRMSSTPWPWHSSTFFRSRSTSS